MWFHSEETAFNRRLLRVIKNNVTYHEVVPENFGNALGKLSQIILHVLLNQVYSETVCDLFTKGIIIKTLSGSKLKGKFH